MNFVLGDKDMMEDSAIKAKTVAMDAKNVAMDDDSNPAKGK